MYRGNTSIENSEFVVSGCISEKGAKISLHTWLTSEGRTVIRCGRLNEANVRVEYH